MDTKALRIKRKRLIDEARVIAKKAETENRELTADERGKIDEHLSASSDLAEKINREDRIAQAEASEICIYADSSSADSSSAPASEAAASPRATMTRAGRSIRSWIAYPFWST